MIEDEIGERVQFIADGKLVGGVLVRPFSSVPITWEIRIEGTGELTWIAVGTFMKVPEPEPPIPLQARDVNAALFLAESHNAATRLFFPINRVIHLEGDVLVFWSIADPKQIIAIGPNGSFAVGLTTEPLSEESLTNAEIAAETGAMNMAVARFHEAVLARAADSLEGNPE